jgi:hypothetical protein
MAHAGEAGEAGMSDDVLLSYLCCKQKTNELYTKIIPLKLKGEVQALRTNPSKINLAATSSGG